MSTTDNRGYAEVPVNVAPDVPHYVNKALRQIDADVEAVTVQSAAEVAALAASLGVKGKPLEYEDAVMAGLVAKTSSGTSKELAKTYVRKSDVSGAGFPVWSGIQRMYLAGNMPADGPKAGDLVLSVGGVPLGPANIGGCAGWWDFSTSTAGATNKVWRLDDLSGHGRDLSATANQPVLQIAGGLYPYPRGVFSTESGDRWLTYERAGDVITSGNFTVFCVAAPRQKPSGNNAVFGGGAGTGNILFSTSQNAWMIQGGGSTLRGTVGRFVPDDVPRAFLLEYDGATGAAELRINGEVVVAGTLPVNLAMSGGAFMGARTAAGADTLWGSINELVIFDRKLTTQEKTDLYAVSRTRWRTA